MRRPTDSHIEPAVGQHPILLGHAGLDLVHLEVRVGVTQSVQHLRHGVEARVPYRYGDDRVRRDRGACH